ncbi:MAG TPA: UDP-N-acetylmuramoyl-tripeptide--D-alanyl-D-alanine ligase [Gemmatimonadales bacterium]|nr:UDP-N-acetylmuramoyl-tripeptide--D-alanyl-D-alanine ligase [Gemmatimonadales bacterium]
MSWTGAGVRAALDLPAGAGPGRTFSGISTDTRTLGEGALFVALTGERFDGHAHLAEAAARGAAAAVVRQGTPPVAGLELFEVPDTLAAFGWLARARRRAISGPVVAVTGTNGKTSTKEMLALALGTRFRVHATRANLNNLVGVPQTILEAPADTEALVVEAGASVPGEIGRYRRIIEPTVSVVTNVSAGHLEGFGSLDGVLAEKLALVEGVGLAVVGTEPAALTTGARKLARRVVTAGLDGAELRPESVTLDPGGRATVDVGSTRFTLPLPGRHLAANAMLAWAVAIHLGLDPRAVGRALERLVVPGGRGQVEQVGGLTILNDCYNASPLSFRAAIATAQAMRAGRRLVFVAGTMRELGTESAALHAAVAADLVALRPELLAAVGEFVPVLDRHRPELGDRLLVADDVPALGAALAGRLAGDELIVLKASRGVALERIIPLLTPRAAHGPEA